MDYETKITRTMRGELKHVKAGPPMRKGPLTLAALLAMAALFAAMPSERSAIADCEAAGVRSSETCNQYAR